MGKEFEAWWEKHGNDEWTAKEACFQGFQHAKPDWFDGFSDGMSYAQGPDKDRSIAIQDAPVVCQHSQAIARRDHVMCVTCGAIKTDGGWGIASRMWFKSMTDALFYRSTGKYIGEGE